MKTYVAVKTKLDTECLLASLEQKSFIKITRSGMGSYIQPLSEIHTAVDGEFDGAEVGDKVELEFIKMTQGQYDKLPEFGGW